MKIWNEILETAIHAPSPHNVQPWRVKIISETAAELYIDSRRTLPKEDVTGSFIILAMGMFIEALKILAAPKGFRLEYELFHEPDWFAPAILETTEHALIPFAKLELIESAPAANHYDENLFFKRRTSRLHLTDDTVPADALEKLSEIARERQQNFAAITDAATIERILKYNTAALFKDLNAAEYHDEIVEWFRYSDKQSQRRLDGLDYRSMNVSPVNLWLSAKMPWLLRVPIVKQIFAKVYRAQIGLVPTLGIISGGFWKPADAIEAGKFLMRFWLETAAHNLYIHPFGNLVTNRPTAEAVERQIHIADIWLIFKIGRSAEPPKSRRLPVERRLISTDGSSYLILFAPWFQPFLAWIGRVRAYAVFYKAQQRCPAYREFLQAENYRLDEWKIEDVPIMTKENYVKKYSIEARCYDGKIPSVGTVIDESSGSSGVPNNWVRSADERREVTRILQLNYDIFYHDQQHILLNCFALGPWATGMNVSMSLVDVGILKSIGPDAAKLENTLALFGTNYRYLICGYPPFVKSWIDSTSLDLSAFKMDLIVGGEGMSESLRSFFLDKFQTVVSSYGASDLEINIGVETELTISIRRLCFKNRDLCEKLFGRETPPMIFQFNAADYVIETDASSGELLYTIVRLTGAAPKIRYNLRDLGGTYSHQTLGAKLWENGINIKNMSARQSFFPLLYVHGRGDLTVAFYGAKVYPTDIEEIVSTHKDLKGKINSFQILSREDENFNKTLHIHLEKTKNIRGDLPATEQLREILFAELCRLNQDFREVTKMFDKKCVEIIVHDYETGVFAGRDIRVKNKYIG